MNFKQSVIFVENGNYAKVKKALKQWIELYSDTLDPGLTFRLFQGDNLTVIELSQDIDNEHFNYLVNYLTYPEGINHHVIVNGYTRITDKSLCPEHLFHETVQIFIPEDDTQFDLVYGVFKSGETFKFDFGGKNEPVNSVKSFSEPNTNYRDYSSETVGIEKKKFEQKRSLSQRQKFDRRFNIIAPVYVAAIMIAGYFTYGSETFLYVVQAASFGMFFWVILEHDRLPMDGAYLKLLAISIFLTVLGYYASMDHSFDIWMKATRMGLCFLILYKILRYVYVSMFSREPELDKHSEHFADKVYSLILMMGAVAASLLI